MRGDIILRLQVKITDYGFSDSLKRYYVTYHITGLGDDDFGQLIHRLEDPVMVKGNEIYLNVYFDKEYYPFGAADSQNRFEDYQAREEIEMTAYLLELLEEDSK
jgi:hypothetical protein